MSQADHTTDWERAIRNMIARSTETAPTDPGVFRMPCGNCYVDFFVAADGTRHRRRSDELNRRRRVAPRRASALRTKRRRMLPATALRQRRG